MGTYLFLSQCVGCQAPPQALGCQSVSSDCQHNLRQFTGGAPFTVQPCQSRAFLLVQELASERSPRDCLLIAGCSCLLGTGQAPEANAILVGQEHAPLGLQIAPLYQPPGRQGALPPAAPRRRDRLAA